MSQVEDIQFDLETLELHIEQARLVIEVEKRNIGHYEREIETRRGYVEKAEKAIKDTREWLERADIKRRTYRAMLGLEKSVKEQGEEAVTTE